ncbi:MAG TPA: MFS transporter [Oceanithermus profundus]|uniref:MFS transporter n=1 Tax=Oceanithermus profundus TaxID=187137 RepID=A0A7C4VG42_9DEIN|nr:MFS transporter [Oceanithermus profundus]
MPALELLRDPHYRNYWISLFVSQLGTWMQSAAQAWLVIELTGSAERLGLVVALQFAPSLLFSLPAGVLADRWPRRTLLRITQGSMAALALAMAALLFTGAITYGWVLVFATLYGLANVFDLPTRQAFTVELATRDRYPGAIALNSFSFNVARLAGPAIAGLLIARLGMGWAFLINGLSFFPMLVFLSVVPVGLAAAGARGNPLAQLAAGLAYVRRTPEVLSAIVLIFWAGTFAINFQTLVPAYARLVLGLGAEGYGGIMSAMGAGALVGAVGQALARGFTPRRIDYGVGVLVTAHLLLFLPLGPWAVAAVMGLAGLGMVLTLVGTNTLIQTAVPDDLRGRVISIYMLALLGSGPPGSYLTGWLMDVLGGRAAAGALGLLAFAGWAGVRIWAARRARASW